MTFEELIAAFGAKIGVALVADNESCVVGVDDMTVTFLHLDEADKISIYGEIGETPQDGIEELLSTMLEANHLFAGTAGATLSRDKKTGRFCLCRVEPLALLDADSFASVMESFVNTDSFASVMESFVNTLAVWRSIVANYRPDESGAAAPAADPPLSTSFGGFLQV